MCKRFLYLFLVFGFCLAAARGGTLTMAPLCTWDIRDNFWSGSHFGFGNIYALDGIPAAGLITGTSTFANPPGVSPYEPAENADNFSLRTTACADQQPWMKTVFTQPVTTVFMLEKSGNDTGTIQGLDADGSTIGDSVAFATIGGNPDPLIWASTGFYSCLIPGGTSQQIAWGTVITSTIPIYGILITQVPHGVNPGIDPVSITAVPVLVPEPACGFSDDFEGTALDTSLWSVFVDAHGQYHWPYVADGLLHSQGYHTRIDSIPAFAPTGQSVMARASIRLAGEYHKFGFGVNPNERTGPITGYYFDTLSLIPGDPDQGQEDHVRALAWFQPASGDPVNLLNVEILVTWDEFHEFAVERTPSEVIYLIDDLEVARVADAFAGALPVGVWNDRWSLMQTDWVEVNCESAGPVAYWSFDDTSDPGHDDSGNGHNGTIYGAASADGICEKALSFDGQNDYVNFGNAIGNFGTSDFSIVLWLRTNTDRDETLIGKRVFCGEHSFWELNMSEGPAQPGCMLVELYESYPSIYGSFPGNQRIDDNQWHQLAITRRGLEAKLYIDGFLDASRSAAKVINMSNGAPFRMGYGPCIPVPHCDYFSGELDEVRIYDRALSESEIQDLYSACQPALDQFNMCSADLVCLYDFAAAIPYYGLPAEAASVACAIKEIRELKEEGYENRALAKEMLLAINFAAIPLEVTPEPISDLILGGISCIEGKIWEILSSCDGDPYTWGCIKQKWPELLEEFLILAPSRILGISILSPVDIRIIDSQGNVMELNTEGYTDNNLSSPGWIFKGSDHQELALVFDANDQYIVEIVGRPEAGLSSTFDLQLMLQLPDGSQTIFTYLNVPISAQGIAIALIDEEINRTLAVDVDGDGTIDLYVLPEPPVANAGPDQSVEQESYDGTEVILDGSGSTDPDSTEGTNDDIVSFDWFEGVPLLGSGEIINYTFPLGSHTVTLVVTDTVGEADEDEVTIVVQDTTPPDFEFSVTPAVLWPPNHKMVLITPSWTVSDICDDSPEVSLVSIVMNEGDETIGDGHTSDDIQVGDDGSIYLMAERSGTGTGRVYTITYQAVDDSGNVTVQIATVTVPHDRRKSK